MKTSSDAKTSAAKSAESKPAEAKPGEAKTFDPKPAGDPKADAKTEQAETSPRSDPIAMNPLGNASATKPAPTPSASAPTAQTGAGVLGLAAAALAGAALAVLVVALFGRQLIGAPEPDTGRVTALESRLDAAGGDIAALRDGMAKAAQPADTSAIEGRLQELSKSIDSSSGRVGGVEGEVKALAEQVAKPDAALGVLAGRVDGMEMRLPTAPSADELSALGGRVAGVESRIDSAPTQEAVAAIAAQVEGVSGKIDAQVDGASKRIETRIDGVSRKFDAVTIPLARRVDELTAELKVKSAGDPAARMVVALGALDQALADGRPFVAELAAVKSTAGGNAELATLDPYAASGVPTRPQLAATLSAELAKLAPAKVVPTASVFDRFVANAGSVVKVTPKGGATGDDSASVRARVAAAATAGDIEGALAARGTLDEAARAATEEWSRIATARVSAENALNSARTAALARLATND